MLVDDLNAAKAAISTKAAWKAIGIYGAIRAVDAEGSDRFTAMQSALRAQLPGKEYRLALFGKRHSQVTALFNRALKAERALPHQ